MTPKEKAEELHNNMYHELPARMGRYEISKNCALIAVDEIIKAIDFDWMEVQNLDREHAYWDKVKQEIEKL